MNWRAAILSAPRQTPTLARCIRSIMLAGWMQPRVYAEPDTNVSCSAMTRVHAKRQGVGRNWVYALEESLEANPDAVMLFQDDVILANHCREYVEATWPDQAHVLWLYRGGRTEPLKHAPDGWQPTDPTVQTVYGSLAVAVKADIGRRIIDEQGASLRKIGVGFDVHFQLKLVNSMGLRIYQHQPSLGQHIGKTSTLHAGMGLSVSRRAADNWIQDTRNFQRERHNSKPVACDGDDVTESTTADSTEVR